MLTGRSSIYSHHELRLIKMVTVYAKEYLDKNDVIDKSFFDSKNPNAKTDRDKEARELS